MTQPLIAVAGAASKQGRSVVDSLLADGGFRVRALTRSAHNPNWPSHGLNEVRKWYPPMIWLPHSTEHTAYF